jgi:uncharacterized membrane protein
VTTSSRRTTIIVLSIGLLISVCLNLFAAGALVAARWGDRPFVSAASVAMAALPPSLRQELRQELRARRAEVRAAIADLRAARLAMVQVMRKDPLDREALERSMIDVRSKTAALQALLQSAVAASLEKVPASERQKIELPGLGFFSRQRS